MIPKASPYLTRGISPMLIGVSSQPFDDDSYIYELKWDGERCIAYLDPKEGTELINKRNLKMISKVPELTKLHRQVKKRCILDGELMILKNSRPDFYEIQKRSLTSNAFKIQLAAQQYPATFVCFDILFEEENNLTLLPLLERKKKLSKLVSESERMAVSRFIEGRGIQFFELAKKRELEGVVAKKQESIYIPGKRTLDWIKIKNLKDDDFVICGYIFKENNVASLVLGQYRQDGELVYKGHVTMGVNGEAFQNVLAAPKQTNPPFPSSAGLPRSNETAIWLEPVLVCTVKFMDYLENGGLRQPVLKGLRDDKAPLDCVVMA